MSKRHSFALAFSPKRNAPCAHVDLEPDVYVRITPKGRLRLRSTELIESKKKILFDALDITEEPQLLETLCGRGDVAIEEAMLLICEINNFCIRLQDAPADKTFISCFFNGDTGEVWCELYEPNRKDGAQ